MKKLVTSLFLLLGLSVAADGSYAQTPVPVGAPYITKAPRAAIGSIDAHDIMARPQHKKKMKGAVVPLAEETYMIYVDLESEELTNWTLPRLINFQSGETDTMVMFLQRFTNPFDGLSRIYLDSVYSFLQANNIVDQSNNRMEVSFWYAQQPNDAGIIFPLTRIGGTKNFAASTLPLEEITRIGSSFRTTGTKPRRRMINFDSTIVLRDQNGNDVSYEVHPTDFFVGVYVPAYSGLSFEDGEQNQIGVIGDAQFYEGEHDAEIHRGMALGFQYFVPWSGISFDDGDPIYANFAIIAKVSDQESVIVNSVDEESNSIFTLKQNYPNPFNPSTTISYSVTETMPVSIKVFNTMGVEVATLVNEVATAGEMQEISFNASNLPSGNYIYVMSAGGQTITKAMTLAK